MAQIAAVAGDDVAGFQHGLYAGVFKDAPTALQDDRMIVDDQHARHAAPSASALYAPQRMGIAIRTRVPSPLLLSTA